jgi:RNA polymerase sigma factor (sigma-70 family)
VLPRLVGRSDLEPPETALADREVIWSALGVLSHRQRIAIVLRYYEDFTDEQIAQVLGCAQGTVRSLISRALPRLRASIENPKRPSALRGHPR